VCLQLYLIHELVFTFTITALAKYMAYFHYNFHCCTSFVLIYVRRYCRDFIFFTDEPFIMVIFIAPVLIVYYSPNTLLSIMLYALLFSSFGVYIFICVLKNLVYKKEMRGCV